MNDSRFTIPDSRYRLVYILGAGHCGSTLLDMMLARHTRIFAGGELGGIHRYWAIASGRDTPRDTLRSRRQTDWLEVTSHPFQSETWKSAVRCYERKSGQSFDTVYLRHPRWSRLFRMTPQEITRWARPQRLLLDCLSETTGSSLITDSSKRPQRLYLLLRSGEFDLAVIHLIRDGRGVMHSYLNKYGRWGVAFRRWAGPTVMAFYLRRIAGSTPWLDVRYEDLATAPQATLQRICAFLGISFEPAMENFRGGTYLGIGGNRMRENRGEVMLDERWKQDWRGPGRVAFALAGGWLNRLCGY